MSDQKDLVVHKETQQVGSYFPTQQEWNFMVQWGAQALKSRLLPSSISTPEAAAIVVLKGRELGISFMTSISQIYVINGKPGMSAELIQGLARKNLPGLVINILESTSKTAKIEFIRPEKGSKPFVQEFTMEEAIAAKLTSKDVWKQYPAAMLWSRCVTAGLRKVCPEALMGISHTPEELGANVDQEGNVIETTGKRVEGNEAVLPKDQGRGLISKEQVIELVTLARKAEVSDPDMKALIMSYGAQKSSQLTEMAFENIVADLEMKIRETKSQREKQLDVAQEAFGEFDKEMAGRA